MRRTLGFFSATLYLEVREKDTIKPQNQVFVFGEFTVEKPWQVKVPCIWDDKHQCFKADVEIKVGDKFKFVIEKHLNG